MIVGVSRIEILIQGSRSLKDKRQVLKSLTNKINHRFNVSVAEIDHHDLWQRATIAISNVSNTQAEVEKLLRRLTQFAESVSEGEVIRTTYTFYDPDKDFEC